MAKVFLLKTPAIIFIAILALMLLASSAAVYWVLKYGRPTVPVTPSQVKVLTPQEIQEEALSKRAEFPAVSLDEKQVSQALERQVPKGERPAPLTAEEIKKALEAK